MSKLALFPAYETCYVCRYKKRVEEKLKEFEKLTGKSEGTDSSDK